MKKWNIKSILKELAVGALILFILTNIISYLRKPSLDSNQLPHIQSELLDGSQYTLKEGKPVVIHFWATWCPTCKLEANNIERISQDYEVLTISVNSGEDSEIETYLKERGLTFKVLNDKEGKWAEQFKVEAYPTTFIYDSKGILKFSEVGYTTTAGLLARLKLIE
jgi:thiol-disulfide isomerase/thioredoxin